MLLTAVLAVSAVLSPQQDPEASSPPAPQAEVRPVSFERDVRPVLVARCWSCHGAEDQKGDLRLDRRRDVFGNGGDEWLVVPGAPAESRLLEVLELPADDADRMPKDEPSLPREEIEMIRRWIAEGAEWPERADYRPLAQAPVLALDAAARSRSAAALGSLGDRLPGVRAWRVAQNTDAVEVDCGGLGQRFGDEQLAQLAGLERSLTRLDLAGTSITDDGARRLSAFVALRRIDLARTGVGDAAVAALAELTGLRYLNLYGTGVTDAAVEHLLALPELERVFLWRTKVSESAVARLRAARPSLRVDHGGLEAEALAVAVRAATGPVNAMCPVAKDKAARPDIFVVHEGSRVAFCCTRCRAQFAADPAAFAVEPPKPVEAPPSVDTPESVDADKRGPGDAERAPQAKRAK